MADMATLIVIRGLPGSGKTHLAAALQRQLGAGRVVLLDPDATDYDSPEYLAHSRALTEEGVDPKLHAYRYLRGQAYRAIEEGKLIIWNQPFSSLEIFDKMVGRLREHAAVQGRRLAVLVLEVELDPAAARARVEARRQAGGHGPSAEVFDRFVRDFHSFAGHGYRTLTLRGDADVAESVAAVTETLHLVQHGDAGAQ